MSDNNPHSGADADDARTSNFPTRREIMRQRQLREAEEARKEQRRIARQQRREEQAAKGIEPEDYSGIFDPDTGEIRKRSDRHHHGARHSTDTGSVRRQAPSSPADRGRVRRPATPEEPRRERNAGQQQRAVPVAAPAASSTTTESYDPLTTGTKSRRIAIERAKAKRRQRNRKIRTGVTIVAVLAIIAVCVYLAWNAIMGSRHQEEAIQDYPGPGSGSVEIVINPGDSGSVIGQNLVSKNVIKSEGAFLTAWNDNAAASSIQPGTYTLKEEMRAVDALAALLDPSNRSSNAITVPPGFTKAQVVERLSSFGDFSADEVEAAMADAEAIGLPPEAKGDAEGWLAPGTYEVHSDDTAAQVIKRMVDGMKANLDKLQVPEKDRQEVLIKASILEREVNIDEYYPKVARVIENRLTKPQAETVGYLNMDSTVLYGVGKTGGVPTAAELADADNPYNTYKHKGLPPTPIASPSVRAIEATLKPEPGDWLYFVTVNLDTGETKFASTLEEQERNKQEFVKWCEDNKGKC